jgi:hypothetical protein
MLILEVGAMRLRVINLVKQNFFKNYKSYSYMLIFTLQIVHLYWRLVLFDTGVINLVKQNFFQNYKKNFRYAVFTLQIVYRYLYWMLVLCDSGVINLVKQNSKIFPKNK